jgi:hypothetical protein
MSVLNENTIIGASGAGTSDYEIEQSLRLNIDTPKWIKRTPSSDSNRKTWTLSMWHKRGAVGRNLTEILFKGGGSGGSGIIAMHLTNSSYAAEDKIWLSFDGATGANPVTNRVFRDPSGWMHIVLRFDTTQSTVTDRARLYINGELIISTDYTFLWSTSWAGITQNSDWNVNKSGIEHSFGAHQTNQPLDGYLADISFVDGQSLGPDSFGETGDYGEWKPIDVSGLTFGTNGYHLDFADSSAMGNDANGSNNFTTVGIAATDQMVDSPTNNFATLNPLKNGGVVVSEGNTKALGIVGTPSILSTIGMSSGKWYCEFVTKAQYNSIGIVKDSIVALTSPVGVDANGYTYYDTGGIKYNNGTATSYGASWTINDIISITYDADTGSLVFYRNGVSQGVAFSGLSGEFFFAWSDTGNNSLPSGVFNFGADSSFAGNKTPQGNQDSNGIGDFFYAPPSGFLALCTKSLPDVDVIPSENFNTVLWSGNGSATRSITGVGFEPSMLWAKSRTSASNHNLIDAVRGVDVRLLPASTSAEIDSAFFASLDSDGFSLDNANDNDVNQSGQTYVAWNWQAGGSASSNSNGTITSSVSANAAAGFSILTYTGTGAIAATIGHGLSSAPEMIIRKDRDAATNWSVFHASMGTGNGNLSLFLNTTSAQDGGQGFMNNTAPTSTVFTQGDQGFVGVNGRDYISYCFHSVDGYSKVGSYTGNGSADGPFVHCGFRPAFVLIKNKDATQNWQIFDNKRDPYNAVGRYIIPNTSAAEGGANGLPIDFLSNGFKPRHSGSYINDNTLIYIAFAETPFKFSNAR